MSGASITDRILERSTQGMDAAPPGALGLVRFGCWMGVNALTSAWVIYAQMRR